MAKLMHGAKTKKALRKRVKITGGKKIMRRFRQDYFNAAKNSGDRTRQKKGHKMAPKELIKSSKSLLTRYL